MLASNIAHLNPCQNEAFRSQFLKTSAQILKLNEIQLDMLRTTHGGRGMEVSSRDIFGHKLLSKQEKAEICLVSTFWLSLSTPCII